MFTATMSAQPGPQTDFLRSPADICIYGGAAGGGKTGGLILEALRHVRRGANFTAGFFRRPTPQITNPGALWDETLNFYPRLGGTPHLGAREWRWSRGGKIKFSHLQFETTVYDWQGAQIALICFDELTHFTAHQFFYMVSRNRSTCGVRPYIRATCNPDAESWVADFLAWWIDPESGLPIPERAGVLRYYIRVAEKLVWADKPEELMRDLPRPEDLPPGIDPPRPKRPSSTTPIGRSASSSAAIRAAATGCWIWCAGGPTRAMSTDCCSIPPRRTASGSASGSARIRGRPARARRFTWCAHSVPSPWWRLPRAATSSRGSGHSVRSAAPAI